MTVIIVKFYSKLFVCVVTLIYFKLLLKALIVYSLYAEKQLNYATICVRNDSYVRNRVHSKMAPTFTAGGEINGGWLERHKQ